MNSEIKKFIVIFSIALVISLSIPHFSLWNFGVDVGEAETCYSSATIPGRTRTPHWANPNEKKNPPRRCVDQYIQDPSNASIGAKIDQTLIQAGGKITITGTVAKLCNVCDGYIYTCQAFKEYACGADDNFWRLKCAYKNCPVDLPNILHEEGEDTYTKVGNIVSVGLLVVAAAFFLVPSLGVIFVSKSAIIAEAAASGISKAAVAAKLAAAAATKAATVSTIGAGVAQKLQGEEVCGTCYRICGTNYDTDAGRAPQCNKYYGDAEVPIDFKNQTYSCQEGYCGMWENKNIRIEVRDTKGNVVKTDTTKTDAYGTFSYTFDAPYADGEFLAIASVPKDW